MLGNRSPRFMPRIACLAAWTWVILASFAAGGQVSPFDELEEARTPQDREWLWKQFRKDIPPVGNSMTIEDKERLVERFILRHNPAIVELLGGELIAALAARFREVALNGKPYQRLRSALLDAVERADLPDEIRATGRAALLEGLNSPDAALREDTVSHFAYREGEAAIDALLRMIDDPVEANRGAALEWLGKVGRPEVVPVIAEKLRQQALRGDRKSLQHDFTFAFGRRAIAQIEARATGGNAALEPAPDANAGTAPDGLPPGLIHIEDPETFLKPITPATPDSPEARTPASPNKR